MISLLHSEREVTHEERVTCQFYFEMNKKNQGREKCIIYIIWEHKEGV